MSIFLTSDTHFGHANILKHCDRPFQNVEEMNETLITNWNNVVSDNDIVYHLGDFSFRGYTRFKNRLSGEIILIKGNHDDEKQTITEELFVKLGKRQWYLTHVPPLTKRHKYCLCGHIHKKWKSKLIGDRILINVGVDVWGYKPVSLVALNNECNKLIIKRKT